MAKHLKKLNNTSPVVELQSWTFKLDNRFKRLRIWESSWHEQLTLQSVAHRSTAGLATETWKLYNRNYQTPTSVNDETIFVLFFLWRLSYKVGCVITNMVMVNLGKFSHGEWGTHTISKFCLGKCWVEPKINVKIFWGNILASNFLAWWSVWGWEPPYC